MSDKHIRIVIKMTNSFIIHDLSPGGTSDIGNTYPSRAQD